MNAVWSHLKSSTHHSFSGTVKQFNSDLSNTWARGIGACWWPTPRNAAEEAGGLTTAVPEGGWPPAGLCQGFPQHLTAAAAVLPQRHHAPGESFILSKHVLRGWLLAFLQKYRLFFISSLNHYNFHTREDFGERRQCFSVAQAVSWGWQSWQKWLDKPVNKQRLPGTSGSPAKTPHPSIFNQVFREISKINQILLDKSYNTFLVLFWFIF